MDAQTPEPAPEPPAPQKRQRRQLPPWFHRLLFNERRLRFGWRLLLFFALLMLFVGISLFPLIAILLVTIVMTKFVDRRPFTSVGLSTDPGSLRQLFVGFGFGAALFGVLAGAIVVLTPSTVSAGNIQSQILQTVFFYIVVHMSIAAFEELLARGYIFQALIEGVGALPAVGVTAVGFGLLHLGNPNLGAISLINLCLAGVFFGVLVLKTKSLWMAIGVHFAWNVTQGHVLGLPISGIQLDDYWFQMTLDGPSWLTGGAFGPEASLLASLLLALASVWVWRSTWFRLSPLAQQRWDDHIRPRRWRAAPQVEAGADLSNEEAS